MFAHRLSPFTVAPALPLQAECRRYEHTMAACGGVELFIGGTGVHVLLAAPCSLPEQQRVLLAGPDGHIGFNEPGSSLKSRTRVKTLAHETVCHCWVGTIVLVCGTTHAIGCCR